MEELAHGPEADYMRPNFWPNTPDILSGPLRYGPPAAFALRLVLAATLSPSYGGLQRLRAVRERAGLGDQRGVPRLGEVRDQGPGLRPAGQPGPADDRRSTTSAAAIRPSTACGRFASTRPTTRPIVAYSKVSDDRTDVVLVVVNLDPDWPQEATPAARPDAARACPATGRYAVLDELSGRALPLGRARRRTSAWTRRYRRAPTSSTCEPARRGESVRFAQSHRPALVPAGRLLRGPGAGLLRRQRRRHRRPRRASPPSSTTSSGSGVDCLWLLPFYQSPLRDGGYDISDFWTILPEYGDLADAVELVEEAHKRGMRVIADLVMNHTSDQHPWFQESRQDRTNPKADWYVWSDDDTALPRGPGHLRRHRAVQLDLRRPAGPVLLAPLLLPPARPQLRQPRGGRRHARRRPLLARHRPRRLPPRRRALPVRAGRHQRREPARDPRVPASGCARRSTPLYPGRVLLAEANQWPEDVVDYFGDGDECHMCFHFPVMPRMFMAVRREQRHPITEILARTPDIPDGCQWGIFLRNHDELTLEMVTDEERDYM